MLTAVLVCDEEEKKMVTVLTTTCADRVRLLFPTFSTTFCPFASCPKQRRLAAPSTLVPHGGKLNRFLPSIMYIYLRMYVHYCSMSAICLAQRCNVLMPFLVYRYWQPVASAFLIIFSFLLDCVQGIPRSFGTVLP